VDQRVDMINSRENITQTGAIRSNQSHDFWWVVRRDASTSPVQLLVKYSKKRKIGGDAGIRTRGAPFRARRFSKPLVSATHPRLHAGFGAMRIPHGGLPSEGYSGAYGPWQRHFS
jgi:hypothetical protein